MPSALSMLTVTPANTQHCPYLQHRVQREPMMHGIVHDRYLTGVLVRKNLLRMAVEPVHRQGWVPPTLLPLGLTVSRPELSRELTLEMMQRDTVAADLHSSAVRDLSRNSATSRQCSSYCNTSSLMSQFQHVWLEEFSPVHTANTKELFDSQSLSI